MKIMIVGSGGREHALGWKLGQSPFVEQIIYAPGNAGTAWQRKGRNVDIDPLDSARLAAFAHDEGIGMTIIGPELPLVAGVVDVFHWTKLPIVGPTAKAAQLESSKIFAKEFMLRHKIPTAPYRVFFNHNHAAARAHCARATFPIVIKEDGLAGGKGVTVAQTLEEAYAAVKKHLARGPILIEEFLPGEEVSVICIVSGTRVAPLVPAQDYKRLNEGDRGPMTGGIGALAYLHLLGDGLYTHIMEQIVHPTLRGLQEDELSYTGFLYFGLMVADGEPFVLEYNVRMGDPEAQVIMPLARFDVAGVLKAAVKRTPLGYGVWDSRSALCTVLAARGYPEHVRTGDRITGLAEAAKFGVEIFHAGTEMVGKNMVTAGGRVLGVTAIHQSPLIARRNALEAVEKICFEGMHYRRDIGHRPIGREIARIAD